MSSQPFPDAPTAAGEYGVRGQVVAALAGAHLTLATAESLTAGLISAGVADVPGASAVLVGGAVTYASDRKSSVLGVDADLLHARGAVDPDVARHMAIGALDVFDADVAVSATGVAGPSGQDGKPVGTVFIAVAGRQRRSADTRRESTGPDVGCTVHEFHFTGSRPQIRQQAAEAAWQKIIDFVM